MSAWAEQQLAKLNIDETHPQYTQALHAADCGWPAERIARLIAYHRADCDVECAHED